MPSVDAETFAYAIAGPPAARLGMNFWALCW